MLKKAYIEITNRCNLRCSFCPGTKRAPRTMTPAEFDLVLERLTGQAEYVYLHVMGATRSLRSCSPSLRRGRGRSASRRTGRSSRGRRKRCSPHGRSIR